MNLVCWVYAKNADEAIDNAAGGYGSWNTESAAIRDGKDDRRRGEGESLFRVTTLAEKVIVPSSKESR